MRVILLRHGQTGGNLQRRYLGRTDEPLCAQGIAQARAAGILDNLAYAYVSPMLRAIQTAKICFPNAQMHVIEDLREMDFGDFEGRTADEMACDTAYREWVDGNCEGQCPNGEGIASFQQRVQAAFDFLMRDAFARQLKELAVVAHGGTIMAAMSIFANSMRAYYDWHVPHCCGYEAVIEEDAQGEKSHFLEYRFLERLK